MLNYCIVADEPSLERCCARLMTCDAVGLDTEFIRTDTFYPKLGLVQLSDGVDCWLVDPLAIADLTPLRNLLRCAGTLKIIHSCSEDLQVLQHALQVVPTPMFDTQVAAAFVGKGFSLSYGKLVRSITGIELPKHETRSDWLQRPLSESQLEYAAEDVLHLLQIYHRLRDLLIENNRLDWLAEDMARLVKMAAEEDDPELYYRRIKGSWRLDGSQLGVLARLAHWRELEARRLDRPRGRVASDPLLLQLAIRQPDSLRGLSESDGITARQVRVAGEKLLALVREEDAGVCLPGSLPQPLPRSADSLLRRLRQEVQDIAKARAIAPEILARRKDLENIVRVSCDAGRPQLPDSLANGWRYRVVGKKLLEVLKLNQATSAITDLRP